MDEQTVRDLCRKHNGTMFLVQEKSTKENTLIYLHDIQLNAEGVAIMLAIPINQGGGIKHFKLMNYDFIDAPDSRVFDHQGMTYFYKHKPERQWRRGVCHDNSIIQTPIGEMLAHFGADVARYSVDEDIWRPEKLKNLFFPKYRKLNDAIDELEKSSCLSLTVTNKHFISVFMEEDSYVLWRMSKPLCKFFPKENKAVLMDSIYKQEVQDFFTRQGIYYAIQAHS